MNNCLNCKEKSENILCSNCENIETVEKICESLIKYPYVEISETINNVLPTLNNPNNIKLALFALADYFTGDKKDYYKAMSISKGTRVDKICYPSFYKIAVPLIDSIELLKDEKEMLMSLILNSYQSEYDYDKAEEISFKLEKIGQNTWYSTYALGEFYTYTRRYEKARQILEKSLEVVTNDVVTNIVSEKLEDCINRQEGKKKEYVPAPYYAKEKYKEFLASLDIEISLGGKKAKSTKEIEKEDNKDAETTEKQDLGILKENDSSFEDMLDEMDDWL